MIAIISSDGSDAPAHDTHSIAQSRVIDEGSGQNVGTLLYQIQCFR